MFWAPTVYLVLLLVIPYRSFSGGLPVVKPTWVVDSVAANKLLSCKPIISFLFITSNLDSFCRDYFPSIKL